MYSYIIWLFAAPGFLDITISTCQISDQYMYELNMHGTIKCWHMFIYRKQEKICWAKLSQYLQFSRVPQKFYHEYSSIVKYKHCWPRCCKSIHMKAFIGLKLWMFSPANLSTLIYLMLLYCVVIYVFSLWCKDVQHIR